MKIIGELKAEVEKNRFIQKFWDEQVRVLMSKMAYHGLPEDVLRGQDSEKVLADLLEPLKRLPYDWFRKQELRKDRIPFLIVFPSRYLPPKKQIEMVRIDGKMGFMPSMLAANINSTGVDPRSKPYIIFNVEDGSRTTNLNRGDESETLILAEGDLPLTVEEALAMVIQQPGILTKHWVDILGSTCALEKRPTIYLTEDHAEYCYGIKSVQGQKFGAPSCEARSITQKQVKK